MKVLELSKNFQKGFCITEKGVQGCSQVSRLFRGISEHLKKNQGVLKDSQGVSVPWEASKGGSGHVDQGALRVL